MKNAVIVFDKNLQQHYIKEIFRKYKSFGNVPKFDPNHKKSYMFSDNVLDTFTDPIPEEYKQYIDFIKNLDSRYNQFVINVYESGQNYIEPHSDCDKDMVCDYRILILSLGQTRTMRLTSRKSSDVKIDVELKDNSIFLLDKDLNSNYRHEILQDDSKNQRISITARMMKVEEL